MLAVLASVWQDCWQLWQEWQSVGGGSAEEAQWQEQQQSHYLSISVLTVTILQYLTIHSNNNV